MPALFLLVAAADAARLTPDGWGAAKIGMTRQQVEQALHIRLKGEPIDSESACVEMQPVGRDQGIWFMFQDYHLTRISIGDPSKIRTPRGIGIGTSAAEVRRAYGKPLRAEPHHYEGLPSEYLTYWVRPETRGVRFETDSKRRVQTIHAGNGTIQLVEGCA